MEAHILSKVETDEIKGDVDAQLRAFRIFDACPLCGFTGEVEDRGCKLVCGGCGVFVVSTCSDGF
jgi:uncharacterized membrane protein